MGQSTKEPLINVGEAIVARQKWPKKRSLQVVNEHFEAIFNNATVTQVFNQRFPKFYRAAKMTLAK
jgi:hypothetical protein